MITTPVVWELPCRLHYGIGVVKQVGAQAKSVGATRVLVIGDSGVLKAGLLEPVKASLTEAGLPFEVYADMDGEPTVQSVEALYDAYVAAKADAMVAVGGGSVLDSGKAAGILASNPGPLERYNVGGDPIRKRIPPLLTVPTTAGTGAEVSITAVITGRDGKVKLIIAGGTVSPWVALDDAEMTRTMPPKMTAFSGMDALCHCVERFTNTKAAPHSDAPAIRGVRLIGANLRRAVFDGEDMEARDNMLAAALLGGMSRTGVGIAHSVGQALGVLFHVPHGLACAIPLPHMIKFNAMVKPEKLVEVAEALGEPVGHLSPVAAGRRAGEAVEQLMSDCRVPGRLRDVGLAEKDVDGLAEATFRDCGFMLRTNARKVSLDDLKGLCRQMF